MKFKYLFFACAAVQAFCITCGVAGQNLTTLSIAVPGFIFAVLSAINAGEARL